jgi:hypothetical protein
MRVRRTIGALASAVVGATAVGAALPSAAAAAPAPLPVVADWRMDEAAGATRMLDASPNALHGRINADPAFPATVVTGTTVAGATGKAYRWPAPPPGPGGQPARNPNRIVEVPDHALLDPLRRDYAVEVRLRTGATMPNVLQKGQSGGQYFKLEIHEGIPKCVFRGNLRQRGIGWTASVIDSKNPRWMTLRCERRIVTTATGTTVEDVSIVVDGQRRTFRGAVSGSIDNTAALAIGGKKVCSPPSPPGVGCDYFAGWIDRITVEAGPNR